MKILAVVLLLSGGWLEAGVTIVDSARVYVSSDGAKITLMTVQVSEKFAIAKFEGTHTELDGRILPHAITTEAGRVDYLFKYGDKAKYFLSLSRDRGLRFNGSQTPLNLWDDPKLSSAALGDEMLKAYLGERSVSVQTTSVAERFAGEYKKLSNELKSACGFEIPVKLDIDSFPRGILSRFSVEDACIKSVEPLAAICTEQDGKAELKKALASVNCRFGKTAGPKLESKVLQINFSEDTSKQDYKTKLYLLEII